MTTVLGVNISHNTSICQVTDGRIDFFYDEGRVSRKKYYLDYLLSEKFDGLASIERYVSRQKIDHVIYASFGRLDSKEYTVIEKIQQQLGNPSFEFNPVNHHVYHAECVFNFSKVEQALVVVMDSGGSMRYSHAPYFQEIESVYLLDKDNIKEKFKHLSAYRWNDLGVFSIADGGYSVQEYNMLDTEIKLSFERGSAAMFSILTKQLGLGNGNQSGKTMGLAAYGTLNGSRPEDMARQLQEITKQNTIKFLAKAMSYHNCKNILLSGGYSLNCTNNYLYLSEFPNHNFFIDPIGHDGGTSIGAALYYFRKNKLQF